MYLGTGSGAIFESNVGDTLAPSPSAATADLSESGNFADSSPCGDGLDTGYVAQDFEMHGVSSRGVPTGSKG
jgi:hypothetical protein